MATDKVNLSSLHTAMTRFQQTQALQDKAKAAKSGGSAHDTAPAGAADRFERSVEADSYEQLARTMVIGREAVAAQPDVRQERIDEVKQKMLDGEIITPEVRERVSQSLERVMKILDLFVS